MTAQPKPLRIKRLTLTDFRAFPGPAPAHFDLDGKNLLIYGENGAGKSSVFHALAGFFSLKPARPLREHKNVFSGEADTSCKVSVEFTDGTAAVDWTISRHPGAIGSKSADLRVTEAALRRACLDYRSLLDTNYRHGHGPINLFDTAVEHLLRDYPVTVSGGQSTTIGELWAKVLRSMPSKHTSAAITRINQACLEFNTAFRDAIPVLVPHIQAMLRALGWHDVEIRGINTSGLTYNNAGLRQNRAIEGQVLTPELTFRNHPLPAPQIFLNEARLSALGLAIYLAGRLACTPTATQDALKLLVLDDVLIGLDHSNRLPVLDVLHTHFADWQVVLLTHDKTWFDLARKRLPKDDWVCCEVYEGVSTATAPMPIVFKVESDIPRALLTKATSLLPAYCEAAANYARQAFELGMRIACEVIPIEMPFKQSSQNHKSQELLDKLVKWKVKGRIAKQGTTQKNWDDALHRLQMFKDVVMNPYSHPSAPNIPKQEVVDAIAAVTAFLDLVAKK